MWWYDPSVSIMLRHDLQSEFDKFCMMLIVYLLLGLLVQVHPGAITSNIPVIVNPNKNYTSSASQWLTSPYFRAGNEAVISTLTGNDKTPTYTFTFSSTLPGLPNIAYGIKNYRGNDYFGQEFYEIKKIGLTSATFSVSIQIYGITNLWLLTVAYLAVDPSFPHHLNSFDNVPINYTAGDIVNISSMQSQLTYYTNYINYTDQATGLSHNQFTKPYSSNNIVLFVTSYWVRALYGSPPGYNPVKFHIYTGIVNESYYFWNATLETNTMVTNVHFSQIIFNSDDVQSSKKYFIVYETWINDMNGGFIEIPQAFVDNFIMGVTAFETVDGHCGFQYQWQFANSTINGTVTFGVNLLLSWTLTNTCGFAWSLSSIFYMQTWLCSPPYSYFNLTSGLCQTLCGGFNYQNTLNFTCEPCVNTLCYECNDPTHNLCTNCASYLFYELVNGSCSCMSGYFPASSLCMPCSNASTGCLSCNYSDGANGTLAYNSSNFQCIACNNTSNYFLKGGLCQLCTLSNCMTCLNLTACSTCAITYSPSVTLLCVHCNVTGCAYCSDSDPSNCSVCNSSLGYYLSGQICLPETPTSQSQMLLLFILLPLLLALCCCCLIILCIWRRRRHEENQVQEEQEQKNFDNINQAKPYKVDSKKLEAKIGHNETEGNELSMNEFKEINELKIEVQVPKEKSEVHERSEVNEKSEVSEQSDFSRPSENQEDSRGCHY